MESELIKAFVLSLAVWSLASAADSGQLLNSEDSGDWSSAVFHINNSDNVRLSSTSVTSQHAALNIDFYDGYYVAEIMEMKTGDDIGNVISSERVEVECQVRIDRNPVFTPTCTFNDDNTTWFVTLGKGLGDRFIEEMESGSTLRIKLLDGKDAIYDRYSLRGFSGAYRRGMSLMSGIGKGNDSDYFSDGTRL